MSGLLMVGAVAVTVGALAGGCSSPGREFGPTPSEAGQPSGGGMAVEGDGDRAGAPVMQPGECPDGKTDCPPLGMSMGGAGGGQPMSLGGMAGMPEMNEAGAGGEGGAPPIEVGPICGDGAVDPDEKCDDGGTTPGDGCNATCRAESGWLCDGGEPTHCTSICGDGIVVGAEAEAGGCDDKNGAALDGCSVSCKVEAGYVCSGEPSTCAKTCGDGKVDPGEGCDDKNVASGDGCTACAIETGFSCDSSMAPSQCKDVDECKSNTDNCAAKAACTNTIGAFTCKCNGGYQGNGVTCDDIDECKDNSDDCDANATCTNIVGAFSCACKNGYWGSGVSCAPNPVITSFTADYSRVCSGGTVTFSASYKNGTGTIDHSVGSIVSGKTKVSGAIAASTVFKLTVSAAGGTPATAQVTVDPIANGTFVLTKNPSGIVGPLTMVDVVKLKDGRVLVFGANGGGQGSAQIFDPRDETFATTGLSSGSYPTLAALTDGRVLVTAGDGSKEANVYNPVSKISTATGSDMVQARSEGLGLPLSNGKVLILGGLVFEAGTGVASVLKTSELYDPVAIANGSFSAGPTMNFAHYFAGHGLLPNSHKILLVGGCSDGDCITQTANADLYDPTVGKAGAFLKAGAMSSQRYAHATVALADDRVLVAGGLTSSDTLIPVKTAELYDPQAGDPQNGIFGAFQATGAMGTARYAPSATLLKNGKVLIAGGGSDGKGLKSSEIYDPQTGKFTASGSMNYARAGHHGVLLDNGMVLIGPDATELYCQ
jgi:cysteine-rich repeat protein